MAATEDSRATAELADRVAGSADARAYVQRYARLIERNPSTPRPVRDRIGVLIRRIADPEPPYLRILPEVLTVLVALLVAAVLVAVGWIDAVPLHLFAAVCGGLLIAHPILVRVYRRWTGRRRARTVEELEVLLPS